MEGCSPSGHLCAFGLGVHVGLIVALKRDFRKRKMPGYRSARRTPRRCLTRLPPALIHLNHRNRRGGAEDGPAQFTGSMRRTVPSEALPPEPRSVATKM